jgi:hypothetical protein
MPLTFDDTLPLPEEVEKESHIKAGDDAEAIAWLVKRNVDALPQRAALIQYGMIWNPETGRYRFTIYEPDHVGPKHPPELAVPIMEDGIFVDLLFISDEMSFARATCRAHWLGSACPRQCALPRHGYHGSTVGLVAGRIRQNLVASTRNFSSTGVSRISAAPRARNRSDVFAKQRRSSSSHALR